MLRKKWQNTELYKIKYEHNSIKYVSVYIHVSRYIRHTQHTWNATTAVLMTNTVNAKGIITVTVFIKGC